MKKIYKALLAPIDKEGYSTGDIVKVIAGSLDKKIVSIATTDAVYSSIYQAQRLIITDETPYQEINGGHVLCPDGASVVNVIGYESDLKKYWCVVSGAKCLIDGSDYKKVIATYPNIEGTAQIDITDVIKWVDNGCSESVELEVETIVTQTSNKEDTFPIRTYYDYLPSLTNNTVKMVWDKVDYESGNMTKDMLQSKLIEKCKEFEIMLSIADKQYPINWDALRDKWINNAALFDIRNKDLAKRIFNWFKNNVK